MGASEGPESDGHPAEEITASVTELRALETEIFDAGVMEGDIRLVDTVDAKITLDPSSWHYLARLIPALTIDELEERFGRGSAVRTMHALHNLGLLATAVPNEESDDPETADESGWLEKLADDVSTSEPGDWDSAVDVEIEIKESQRQPVEAGTIRSVAADASTTLTGGVYDDIRRLRSKASE
jgi:hypothetical protein